MHQLVEAQAARTPGAPAVLCGEAQLSYGELNGRANVVARALRARGVGPGAYVPVLLAGGPEVVIAMLAVMKAGAAFVPLDLEWPVERIRAALGELPSGVALVGPGLPFREALLGRPVLVVEPGAAGEPGAGEAAANLDLPSDGEAPIYAIYTSGSTGIPKAAVVPHRGITNRLLWMNEFFGPATAAAVLQTTRHVYDSAVWQLFWPLINGGRAILPGPGAEVSAEALARLIERHQVTITDFVPSVFNALVPQLVAAAPLRQQLGSLRAVIVGGEEITPATTYRFMAAFPGVRVINLYGPTEASIGCICYEVTGTEGESIPIGRPIANVRVLVLDPYRNPVPVGVAGELYLGGRCVGLGYLNDAEKTGASFVDPGVGELGGGQWYRTGDRVRYRPDGTARVSRSAGPPGEATRPADRAGRDRERPPAASRGARERGPAARGYPGRQAPGGLRGAGRGPGLQRQRAAGQRAARLSEPDAAGLHAAHGLRAAGRAAPLAGGQGVSPGAAPPRLYPPGAGRRGGAPHPDRGRDRPDLGRGPAAGAGGDPRQLLRARRPLAARHASVSPGCEPNSGSRCRCERSSRAQRSLDSLGGSTPLTACSRKWHR